MEEQPLKPKEWIGAVRRRWRSIAALTVAGALCGVAYGVHERPIATSSSLVLFPPSGLNNSLNTNAPSSGTPMSTEVQIAMSPRVLDPAGRRVDRSLGYDALRRQVVAIGLTQDVLQITAKASTSSEAERLANGVAHSFVVYTNDQPDSLLKVVVSLQGLANALQSQINDLDSEIASEQASHGPASLVNTLQSEEQATTLQFDSVQSQISQAQLSESTVSPGPLVLERASKPLPPSKLRLPLYGLYGALAGLLVGAVSALVVRSRDHRLRRRDDIAEVVGAPVVSSITVHSDGGTKNWTDLLTRWEPGGEDLWMMRKLLHRLAENEATDVTIVSVAGDKAGLALAPRLAVGAAAIGVPTAFVDRTGHESASELSRASAILAATPKPARTNLWVCTSNEGSETASIGLKLTAVVLDPDEPQWIDKPHWVDKRQRSTTWLALSSGFATAEELARISLVADGQCPITSIVVLNPDPADMTVGRRSFSDQWPAPDSKRAMGNLKGITW